MFPLKLKSCVCLLGVCGAVFFYCFSSRKSNLIQIASLDFQAPSSLLSELKAGENVPKGDFVLRNDSRERRSLSCTGLSCGCAQVKVNGRRLPVGERFEIEPEESLTVTLMGDISPTPGVRTYRASFQEVDRTDSKGQEYILTLGTTVLPDVEVSPDVLVFDFSTPANELHRTGRTVSVEVTRNFRSKSRQDEEPILSALPDNVRVVSLQRNAEQRSREDGILSTTWKVELVASPPERISELLVSATLVTFPSNESSEVVPALLRTVIKTMRGIVAPHFVYLGDVCIGKTVTKRIVLQANDDQAFALTDVASGMLELRVVPLLAGNSKQHFIDLVFTPGKVGEFKRSVKLTTSHTQSTIIGIEVIGHGLVCQGGGYP
jgi:hypothetical protein